MTVHGEPLGTSIVTFSNGIWLVGGSSEVCSCFAGASFSIWAVAPFWKGGGSGIVGIVMVKRVKVSDSVLKFVDATEVAKDEPVVGCFIIIPNLDLRFFGCFSGDVD